MQLTVTDVEQLKKKVRKMTAGRVLAGGVANVCLEMGTVRGCRVMIAAGFGPLSDGPQAVAHDRLLWILDGRLEVHDASGEASTVSQGESAVLSAGRSFQLVFPQLTIYLAVEPATG
jgi:hypothetical protein